MSEDEKSDTEDKEEAELGVMEDQRSVILHLISQLKLGMDLTKVSWHAPVGCGRMFGCRVYLSAFPLAFPSSGETGKAESGRAQWSAGVPGRWKGGVRPSSEREACV